MIDVFRNPAHPTPTNGRPYYCRYCGAGFGEFLACEEPDCELESKEDAAKRVRPKRRAPQQGEK